MANLFVTKRGDTRPLRALLTRPSGVGELFPTHTGRFYLANSAGDLLIDEAITVFATLQTDADGNEYNVQFSPTADHFDLPQGSYRAEFEITALAGTVTTYPTDGFIMVQIIEDLD
jgi:hypothetical protein